MFDKDRLTYRIISRQVRTILYRARNLPPSPTSIATMEIPEALKINDRGGTFVQSIDRDTGMVILASDEQLRQLPECNMLFMDGTFKTCPKLWSQLYLIKGQVRQGQNLLMAAILLKRKTTETYIQMFRKLKSLIMEKHGLILSPRMIMSDFETALMPAIQQEFSETTHKGCYFHYSQAVYRFILNNGYQP